METKYFIYDGIKSEDVGLYLSAVNVGMQETPYFGGVNLREEKINGRLTSYFYDLDPQPLEFTLCVSPLDKSWTPQLKNFLGRWLFKLTYRPLQFSDDLSKVYYAFPVEALNFHTYASKGYIEIKMRTNSAYAWSTVYEDEFDLSGAIDKNGHYVSHITKTDNEEEIITLYNGTNLDYNIFPMLEIENCSNVSDNEVVVKNYTNGGAETIIKKFDSTNEIVALDNYNEVITSSLPNAKPFQRFNRQWLELVPGENVIGVKGRCKIRVRTQFPILQ